MEIVHRRSLDLSPSTAPIFVGEVEAAALVVGTGGRPGVSLVRFIAGAKNRWHVHTRDQVLYFVEGRGIVATRTEEQHLEAGDVATIPAGIEHWHGAEPGSDMAHLSILLPGETTVVE